MVQSVELQVNPERNFLRPVANDDLERLWIWANDPQIRANSFNQQSIDWEEHCRWFRARLADPNWRAYIGIDNAQPIGMVRFQIHDVIANIGVNISATARGQGWGKKIIAHGCALIFSETPVNKITALIKPENCLSLAVFRATGFQESTALPDFPFPHRYLVLLRPH